MKARVWISLLIGSCVAWSALPRPVFAYDLHRILGFFALAQVADPIQRLAGRVRLLAELAADPASVEPFLNHIQSETAKPRIEIQPDVEILLSKFGHPLSPQAQKQLEKLVDGVPPPLKRVPLPSGFSPGTLPEQLKALIQSGNKATRWAAVHAAAEGSLVHPEFQSVLVEALSDASPEIQKLALIHLRRISNLYRITQSALENKAVTDLSERLFKLLASERPEVRSAAARALARQGDSGKYAENLIFMLGKEAALGKKADRAFLMDLVLAIKESYLSAKVNPSIRLGELLLQPTVPAPIKNEVIQILWSVPKHTGKPPLESDLLILRALKRDADPKVARSAESGLDFLETRFDLSLPNEDEVQKKGLQQLVSGLFGKICKTSWDDYTPRF